MTTSKLSPSLVKCIDGILNQYKDLLGADFIRRTRKGMEPFLQQETAGGLRVTDESNLKVAVVGAFSCGKSTFINSILGDTVAPVEITPKTHGVTSFIYGDKETYDADGVNINREKYQEQVQDGNNQVKHFIVHYPCERLKSLEFMDSPGFGSVSGKAEEVAKKDTALSEEAVNRADVVFFLTNITEGVIQGDALERLEGICNQKEGMVNPHRRIYVILTWADKKAPTERLNVQQSIQKLCSEHKLPIESVLLYSSLSLEKFKSSQQREFFSAARENLFRILLDLQSFRMELMAYRQALQSKSEQLKIQHFLNNFLTGCRQIMATQKEIQTHEIQRNNLRNWTGFREEAADCIYKVLMEKFDDKRYLMGHAEEMKVFSDSRVELYCHEDVVSLTEEELSSITDSIVDIGKKYNYKITTTGNSPFTIFFSKKTEKKELPLSGNEEPYNHLMDYMFTPDGVEVFPTGSLRDLYLKLCVEMILSVGGPWMYEGAKPDEFLYEKLDELKVLLDTEAKDGFAGIIDSEMKSALTNGFLQKSLEQMEKQFTSLSKALDKIKIESVDDTLEDMSLEELAASIGAEITCPTADDSSAKDQEVVDDGSLHDVIVNKVGPRSLWVAKTINFLNRKNLEDILEGLETPPLTCLQKVSLPEAVRAQSALEKVGAEITLKQVKAASRPALSDTKKPTMQKNSNGDKKIFKASEATYNRLANAHSVLASVLANNAQQKAGISPKISISEQKTPNSNSADMYVITMISPGTKVMSVGRCLVRLTGKDLEDLLESMEEMPMVIAEKATSEQTEQFKSELEPLGVALEIKKLEQKPLVTVSCKLLLTSTGPKIMKVARLLGPKTGLEVENILEKFEELPFVIASEMKVEDAEELKNQLEELGASVNLEKDETPLNPITYSLILTDTGSKIMKVGRLVATISGKELETVLEGLEDLPYIVKEGLLAEEAAQFIAQLEELGANTEIKENKNLDSNNNGNRAKGIIYNAEDEAVPPKKAQIKSEKTPQKRGDKVKSEKSLQKQGNKVKSEKIPQKQGNNPSPKLPRPTSSSPIAVEKQFSMNEPSHSTKASSPKAVKKDPIEKDASQTIDTDLIWEKIESVLSSIQDDNVFVRSNLNYKKLGNAIQKYASGAQNETVLLQVDDTVFGAADEGLIVTNKAVYWRHTFIDPIRTLLNRRIKNIELQEGNIFYCDRQKIGEIILPDKKTTNPKILELLRLVAKLNP